MTPLHSMPPSRRCCGFIATLRGRLRREIPRIRYHGEREFAFIADQRHCLTGFEFTAIESDYGCRSGASSTYMIEAMARRA